MYDVIGDIHGFATELVRLLLKMGYEKHGRGYRHPDRKVIFVGDFVDRGPEIAECLAIARSMVDAGDAHAVMGNHEFNALCFHTKSSTHPPGYLREHSDKNLQQHGETLRQLGPEQLQDYLAWFRTLPLSLELDGIRVVHACWDQKQISVIRSNLERFGGVTEEFLQEASLSGGRLYNAVEDVLKGKEIDLPAGVTYSDKGGHLRTRMRARWYENPVGHTYLSYALSAYADLPTEELAEHLVASLAAYPSEDVPVFFGHYWLRAERPDVLAPNVACVDYSVAKDGLLVAYRWSDERVLSAENFEWVKARTS